jgi:hypothetical protein
VCTKAWGQGGTICPYFTWRQPMVVRMMRLTKAAIECADHHSAPTAVTMRTPITAG